MNGLSGLSGLSAFVGGSGNTPVANITYGLATPIVTPYGNTSINVDAWTWTLTGPEDATGVSWTPAATDTPGAIDFTDCSFASGWTVELDGSGSIDHLYLCWTGAALIASKTAGNSTAAPTVTNGQVLGPTSLSVDVTVPAGAKASTVFVNPGIPPDLGPPVQIVNITVSGTVTLEGLTPDSDYYVNAHATDYGYTSADSAGEQLHTDPE